MAISGKCPRTTDYPLGGTGRLGAVTWAEVNNWLVVPLVIAAMVGFGGAWLAKHNAALKSSPRVLPASDTRRDNSNT